MKINSEIFDEYAKIALEQGLISEAVEETNPRYDTKTLSDIEILYGIKPNGKEDDIDIVDKAHPTSVIISPAYDRVNGLVPNLKEQSNISKGIAMKPNDGKLTNHRYVQASQARQIETNQKLLDEVINTAFMLDKYDQQDLMVLADSCAGRIVKNSIVFLGIPLVYWGVVALLGAAEGMMYLSNNPESQGIKQDAQRALEQLDHAMNGHWYDSGYSQLLPILQPVVTNITNIVKLSDEFHSYNALLTNSLLNVSSATSDEDKKKVVARNAVELFSSGKDKEITSSLLLFKKTCDAVVASLPTAIASLSEAPEQDREAESEAFRALRSVKEKFLNSDVTDAINMLKNMYKSCSNVSSAISQSLHKLDLLRDQVGKVTDISTNVEQSKPTSSNPEYTKLPLWE